MILASILLTSCSPPNPDRPPEDAKIRDGIKLLITDFTNRHPELVNWNQSAVKIQLTRKIPAGYATEAGWYITWANPTPTELPFVVIPWSVLAQYPNTFSKKSANYDGGKPVPQSVAADIRNEQQKGDTYFAAVVNIKYSIVDSSWIIFTSIPYLPVTDQAYGWANSKSGKWTITDFGTATVGCGRVPTAVQSEFGFSCPLNS